MRDFIERLRSKPEHIRRRIALGTSLGVTGVVAAAWFFTLLFAGTLSLAIPANVVGQDGTLADSGANETGITGNGNDANVAGAGASSAFGEVPQQTLFSTVLAAVGISTAPPAPAALQVEDQAPSTSDATSGPTVIPF